MWGRIKPLMPTDPVRGRRWADHRRTLEAIAWKYRTCSPWRDLPSELGAFQTAHKRLIRWAVDGTWERILAAVLTAADDRDDVDWTSLGGLHRLPGLPAFRRSQEKGVPGWPEPEDHALGRSRGGLSTKVHLASDSRARPLGIHVNAGQAGSDRLAVGDVLGRLRAVRVVPPSAVLDRSWVGRAERVPSAGAVAPPRATSGAARSGKVRCTELTRRPVRCGGGWWPFPPEGRIRVPCGPVRRPRRS